MTSEVPSPLMDENNELVGFTCERLVSTNELGQAEMVFYFDMSVPDSPNEVEIGLDAVRQIITDGMADAYGFTSDQDPCGERVNTDWIVHFSVARSQFKKDDTFDTCRTIPVLPGENCGFYEGRVTAKVVLPMPNAALPLVTKQIGLILDTANLENTTMRVKYGSALVVDTSNGRDGGRDELNPPTSVERDPQPTQRSDDDNTITIVGGLLVGAFVLAFLGIVMVLWRRRRAYMDERDTQFALSKSDLRYQQPETTNTESKSVGDEEMPRITLSMADSAVSSAQSFDPDETQQISNVRMGRQQDSSMEFDFGNSFKDQLMGVHGRQTHPKPGYGMSLQGIPDSTSESDADSWAQTDGTIGSLELQLEPITAEV